MNIHQVVKETLQAAPPVAVSAAISTGAYQLDPWIKALTLLYVVMQIIWLGWKAFDKFRGKEEADGS